jgi:hypothetical protein
MPASQIAINVCYSDLDNLSRCTNSSRLRHLKVADLLEAMQLHNSCQKLPDHFRKESRD